MVLLGFCIRCFGIFIMLMMDLFFCFIMLFFFKFICYLNVIVLLYEFRLWVLNFLNGFVWFVFRWFGIFIIFFYVNDGFVFVFFMLCFFLGDLLNILWNFLIVCVFGLYLLVWWFVSEDWFCNFFFRIFLGMKCRSCNL